MPVAAEVGRRNCGNYFAALFFKTAPAMDRQHPGLVFARASAMRKKTRHPESDLQDEGSI